MEYTITHIASELKAARESLGLSQRALSKLAGVPQSHISRIENGTVDLRLSSLIELARALNLELTLVPRKVLPAVKSIVRGSVSHPRRTVRNDPSTMKDLKRIQNSINAFAKSNQAIKEFAQIQSQIKDIENFQIPKSELETLQNATRAIQAIKLDTSYIENIRKVLSEIQNVRNTLAHASIDLPQIEPVRSAYALEDEDNG
jgi:transcriptional regulator with XRE-family HTH domain